MKRILITGVRAPAALDLIRRLFSTGMEIYAADSVCHPLSRASNCITGYFILPPPAQDTKSFIEKLKDIITKHKIDILIPTCEEVFFISKYKYHLEENCIVFCDDFKKLSLLHNKYDFLSAAENCGAFTPDSKIIYSHADIEELEMVGEKVFKPIFSRFASQVLIKPEQSELQKINAHKSFPWLAQKYIPGIEYCTYSIAVKGKLQAHVCYQPTYRAGLGSGIYFTPSFKENIQAFVTKFVDKHNYTGQVGFDFIITDDNRLFVLECNPRATSGIHCLPESLNWANILLGIQKEVVISSKANKMVTLAMLTFGMKYLFSKNLLKFISNFINAKDPVWNTKDIKPTFYQFISLGEIIVKSIRNKVSLKSAATADIEWNGEEI